MPLHFSAHQRSQSDNSQGNNIYSTANAVYQSGQTLGSFGVPALNETPQQQQRGAARIQDQRYYAQGPLAGNAAYMAQYPSGYTPLNERLAAQHLESSPAGPGQRHPSREEPQPANSAMSDVHHYGVPPPYGNEVGASSHAVPGALQPGLPTRPNMHLSTANTAPTLPTLPQIQTQMQQPPSSARPSLSQSHSHSRSSPGTLDTPKYKPYSNRTPETSKFSSPTTSYAPPPGIGPSSYSPLGLADIRPRADTGGSDLMLSPTLAVESESAVQYPTNSNYIAPWPIYAVDWCKLAPKGDHVAAGKLAIGSYMEDNHNYIQILDAQKTQIDPDNPQGERGLEFTKTAEATHSYPVTRIIWEPPSSNKQSTDLLATSGDHLRLWSLPAEHSTHYSNSIGKSGQPLQKLSPLALLSNSKSPEHTAPITSLDWNVVQPSLIITSSIDTTCTIWDIPTLTAKTQLIAHDKEVFDVRFCANSVDVFVSCGADGSVRMFDLRSLEHSTIIYEPPEKTERSAHLSPDPLSASPTRGGIGGTATTHTLSYPPPLLRIAASPHDSHLLATFSGDSHVVRILDVRQPGQALLELKGHGGPINCIEWSNTQRGVLASGADDCLVLLWDLMAPSSNNGGNGGTQPALAGPGSASTQATASSQGGTVTSTGPGPSQERGPGAMWECGYEVSNLSWSPTGLLGVCGGKGIWGVSL